MSAAQALLYIFVLEVKPEDRKLGVDLGEQTYLCNKMTLSHLFCFAVGVYMVCPPVQLFPPAALLVLLLVGGSK